jgi:hypothetical protein
VKQEQSAWRIFYENYLGIELPKANDDGWVNFNCRLPWHDNDQDAHAAVNLKSGNYRCLKSSCAAEARKELGKSDTSQIITPAEFLQLTQGFDAWEAQRIIADISKGIQLEDEAKPDKSLLALPKEVVELVWESQEALEQNNDLVREYCDSRGLKFETLKEAGVGYIENFKGHECLTFPYYAGEQLVALRLRSWHGTYKRFVKGSSQALFLGDHLEHAESRTVVIVEGETDTLVTRQMLNAYAYSHIPVVGVPGTGFRHEWLRHFQEYTRILAIPQSDRPSQQTLLGHLRAAFGSRLEVVQIPWPANIYGGNDISDFYRAAPNLIDDFVQLLGLSAGDLERTKYVLEFDDLEEASERETEWIIPNLIERGTKTLIVGEPKTHKTWIAINMMYAVSRAEAFLGYEKWRPDQPLSAMLIEEEGPTNRLGQRVKKVFGGKPEGSVSVIHRQGVKLDQPESFARLRQEVLRRKPDLIIFDPYASIHNQDENTVQGTQVVQDAINEILRVLPTCAVVVLHHTPKGADGPRGSGALWGAVDGMLRVSKPDVDKIIIKVDERDLPDEHEGGMEFNFDGSTGRFSTSGGVVISAKSKVIATEIDAEPSQKIVEYIRSRDDVEWVNRDDIVSACEMTSNTFRRYIRGLIREGYVDERGEGTRGHPKEYKLLR